MHEPITTAICGMPERRQPRLVEEDPAEVVAVGEDVGLQRQESAARVDEVDAGQAVLLRDLLRAQVLLHRQREVGAALHRGVVGDDDAVAALDDADPGDDPRRGRLPVVEVPGCECIQLEERRAGVEQAVDALARGQLATRAVALEGTLTAALRDGCRALPQLRDERIHALAAALEDVVVRNLGSQHCHREEPIACPGGRRWRPSF